MTLKDLLAGDYRIAHNAAGRRLHLGLLPLGDANAATLDLLRTAKVPVVAGLCATDPFRDRDRLLAEVKALGAVGVINLPSVGLIDGQFGRSLAAAELGYAKEVDFLRAARRAGFLTLGMAFNAEQAALVAPAVDAVVVPKGVDVPGALIWETLKEG
ncbi:MAG TPA: phosphoenolpyruvate hydrolase family protein [Planctomycetota bacterium]